MLIELLGVVIHDESGPHIRYYCTLMRLIGINLWMVQGLVPGVGVSIFHP